MFSIIQEIIKSKLTRLHVSLSLESVQKRLYESEELFEMSSVSVCSSDRADESYCSLSVAPQGGKSKLEVETGAPAELMLSGFTSVDRAI